MGGGAASQESPSGAMGQSPVPFPELLSGAGPTAHDILDLGGNASA